MQSLEPEVEELLLRIAPDSAPQWQGAAPAEIARIEKIAGRPLPRFYRWFLSTMGRGMGPLAHPDLDFSVDRILSCYASGKAKPQSGLLLIGYDDDEMMSLHYFYDLGRPVRDDATVFRASLDCSGRMAEAETLRELLVSGLFDAFRVSRLPQRCDGTFKDDGFDVFLHLDPVMTNLGFRLPFPMGRFRRIYERADAAMMCMVGPKEEPWKFRAFSFGGSRPKDLKYVLRTIERDTPLEVAVDGWEPPLRNKQA